MFWSLKRSVTLPSSKLAGSPTLTLLGGSERTLGNMNRSVPKTIPAMASENAVQARPSQVMKNNVRRDGPAFGGTGLAGIGGLGGGTTAAPGAFGAAVE